MKEKGFTLIELLAVIVILAIIALIATPIILSIVEDSKKESNEISRENYLYSVETAIASKNLQGNTVNDGLYKVMDNGNLCNGTVNENECAGDLLEVKFDGNGLSQGNIAIHNNQIVSNFDFYETPEVLEGQTSIATVSADFSIVEEEGVKYVVVAVRALETTGINSMSVKVTGNSQKMTPTKIVKGFLGTDVENISSDSISSVIGLSKNKTITETENALQYFYFETANPDSIVASDFDVYLNISNYKGDYSYIVSDDTMIPILKLKKLVTNFISYTPGDINNDQSVDASDLNLLRKTQLGLLENTKAADCNGDGSIDILDLIRLKKLYLV